MLTLRLFWDKDQGEIGFQYHDQGAHIPVGMG